MKNLNFIDCLKLIMAYAVIAIHVSAVTRQQWPPMFEWFIRLAVPFFFITSGYLLARKISVQSDADSRLLLRSRSRKLFRLYGKWLIIYFPIALYYFICVSTRSAGGDVARYVSMTLIDGESPYAWPLWFIYSMAIVLLILSFSNRPKRAVSIGMIVFSIIYLINFIDIGSIANPTLRDALKIFDRLTVRSLGGAIYVCAGMLLFRHEKTTSRLMLLPVVLLALSIALFYAELPFSPLSGGVGLFILGLKPGLRDSDTYLKIRASSMWIYYIHMIVLFPLIVIANSSGTYANPVFALGGAITVTSLLALALIRLGRKPGFGWLASLVN